MTTQISGPWGGEVFRVRCLENHHQKGAGERISAGGQRSDGETIGLCGIPGCGDDLVDVLLRRRPVMQASATLFESGLGLGDHEVVKARLRLISSSLVVDQGVAREAAELEHLETPLVVPDGEGHGVGDTVGTLPSAQRHASSERGSS